MRRTSSVMRRPGLEPGTGCPEGVLSPYSTRNLQRLSAPSIDVLARVGANCRELPKSGNTQPHTPSGVAAAKQRRRRIIRELAKSVKQSRRERARRAGDFMALLEFAQLLPALNRGTSAPNTALSLSAVQAPGVESSGGAA